MIAHETDPKEYPIRLGDDLVDEVGGKAITETAYTSLYTVKVARALESLLNITFNVPFGVVLKLECSPLPWLPCEEELLEAQPFPARDADFYCWRRNQELQQAKQLVQISFKLVQGIDKEANVCRN